MNLSNHRKEREKVREGPKDDVDGDDDVDQDEMDEKLKPVVRKEEESGDRGEGNDKSDEVISERTRSVSSSPSES